MTLSFDPSEVAAAERGWDDQHLDLRGARNLLRDAPTAGFTAAVTGPAAHFAAAWGRHAEHLAATAEGEADGIRTEVAEVLAADLRGRERSDFLSDLIEDTLVELLRERR